MPHQSQPPGGLLVPRCLATASHKGGTGKSTVTLEIAAAFASVGARVLVVDMDPQSNATLRLGLEPGTLQAANSVLTLVQHPDRSASLPQQSHWTDSPSIARAHGSVWAIPALPGGDESDLFRDAVREDPYALARALAPLASTYDLILIDLPPEVGGVLTAALLAASGILITVQPEPDSVDGLVPLSETMERVHARHNGDISKPLGFVITMFDGRLLEHRTQVALLEETFPGLIIKPHIPRRTVTIKARGYNLPVLDFDADGRALARVYAQVAQRIARRFEDATLAQYINPLAASALTPEDLLSDTAAAQRDDDALRDLATPHADGAPAPARQDAV